MFFAGLYYFFSVCDSRLVPLSPVFWSSYSGFLQFDIPKSLILWKFLTLTGHTWHCSHSDLCLDDRLRFVNSVNCTNKTASIYVFGCHQNLETFLGLQFYYITFSSRDISGLKNLGASQKCFQLCPQLLIAHRPSQSNMQDLNASAEIKRLF